MRKFLLSTGGSTTKIEVYILDMFRLYMNVYPNEIPNSNIGFDFVISGLKKDEILYSLKSRLESLSDTILGNLRERLLYMNKVNITIGDIQVFDESRVLVEISVNDAREQIEVEL